MNTQHQPNPLELVKGLGLNRRQFLAATTGMAAAATVASVPARHLGERGPRRQRRRRPARQARHHPLHGP